MYSTNTKSSSDYNDLSPYPFQRLSWHEKSKNNFEWAEKCADYWDYMYSSFQDDEEKKRLKINYQIYSGRGDLFMKEDPCNFYGFVPDEDIDGGLADIPYQPLLDQIAKAMVGEQQKRSLKPMAIDYGRYAINHRKKKRLELYQDFIEQNIIRPLKEEAFREVLLKTGTEDIYKLSPEEQQEFQFMAEELTKSKTPKEIEKYMRKDYKSPHETQAQKIVDYLMSELNVKFVTDEGFKHAIITGKEIYYTTIRHNEPYFELVNPLGFTSSASAHTHFIEDGEFAKYEKNIKFTDLFNSFGDKLDSDTLKKVNALVFDQGIDSFSSSHRAGLVAEISAINSRLDNKLFESIPDIRTNEGQHSLKNLYSYFGSEIASSKNNTIKHANIVWKSLRGLYYLTRKTPKGEKRFFLDESYTFNPLKGDVSIKKIWVPEIFNVDKFGTGNAIYLNKGPIKHQWKSLDDPWNVKLPYRGILYNKLMGNAKNVAPLDLGKPWQYKFNVQMAKIHESEATDIGRVLMMNMNAKPKEWSWPKFIMMMKYGKIAPVSSDYEGYNPNDNNIMKEINLSNVNEIASRLQYLEFIANRAALSMNYSPSRLGQVAPYVGVTNTQQSIVQSSYQTEDIYSTHNKVLENLLNELVSLARIAYRNNDKMKTFLLDDMSIAELEINQDILKYSKMATKVRNSSDDYNNTMAMKSYAQAMVQNRLITFPELTKFMWSTNGAEMINIAEDAQENAMKRSEEEYQRQQQILKEKAASDKEIEKSRQAFEAEQRDIQRLHEKELELIRATRYSNQYDIDKNNINDANERKDKELIHESIENQKDRELEISKLRETIALEKLKLKHKK